MPTALIIEDNENNLYMMRFILAKLGYAVLEARDGAAGVEMAKAHRPDLILMDIQLPVLDGYAATRRIRQDDALKAVPIIAVTSYAMVGDKEKALAAGCTAYVEKPINPPAFIKVLERFRQAGGETP
ncbi:MAG: response regulator [Candidatus Aminicenantes bacterium]|nr:response regulator [Candidatus Aminicenantes bacterium]